MTGHAQKPSSGDCLDMAARRGKPELNKVAYWTKPASGKEDSIVPGVNDLGNLRPHVRGRRTKEVRAVMPVVQPKIENLDLKNSKTSAVVSSNASPSLQDTDVSTCVSTAKDQRVSLRNLCVEDKRRVASLIKELARLGEEKENAEKNLEEERKHYEEQILSLVSQQEQILKEFEVQKKLLDYQASILKLQEQQQKNHLQQHPPSKINQSIKPAIKVSQNCDAVTSSRSRENVAQSDSETVPLAYISEAREEDLLHTQRDIGLRNMYMNDTRDDGIDKCSIQVHASTSPPPELDYARLRLQRPFTAIIDKELANQRQLLEATTEHIKILPVGYSGYNVADRYESKKAGTDHEVNEKTQPPHQNREMFMQMMAHSDNPNMKSLHRLADQHQVMKVSLSQNHPVMIETAHPAPPPGYQKNNIYNLGQGNRHLSPEKNDIIARFMQSQCEPVSIKDKHHTARDYTDKAVMTDVAQTESNIQAHPKIKKRKPPPPSYGPLHAPVMSSTQKSSEFGDSLSVNSTILVDHNQQNVRPQHVDGGDVDQIHVRGYQQQNLNDKNNSNKESKNVGHDKKRSKREQDSEVNSVFPHDAERYSMEGIDKQFLKKYKQMSAMDRKSELLKQRFLLLEEQAKLRKILAVKQDQLRVQDHVMNPTEHINLNDDDKVNYELSLLELEKELAKKEQELIKAKELLAKRKQENPQSDLNPKKDKPQQQSTSATSRNICSPNNNLQSKANAQSDSLDVLGQGSLRKEFASRMELKVSPHFSNGERHKCKEQTREMADREVITRNSNKASSETNEELPPHEERYIKGQDGDACIVYPNKKVKDLVKKLDYSLHSDSEADGEIQPEVDQCSAPAGHAHAVYEDIPAAFSIVKTSTPTAEVNTSISFKHIPSIGVDFGQPRKTGTEIMLGQQKQKMGTENTSGEQGQMSWREKQKTHLSSVGDKNCRKESHSSSPLDDTLSVVEIIQTLSETAPVSRRRPQALEHALLSSSLIENPVQHDPGSSLERDTLKSRRDIPDTFMQDELVLNGTFSKGHHLSENLNMGQFTTLSHPKTSLPLPQRASALELFELKAASRRQDHDVVIENGGSLADVEWHDPSSDHEVDEDFYDEGNASSEDESPETIIHTLRNLSDVDIVKRTQRQEFAVSDRDLDSFEQNTKKDTVWRNVSDISRHGTERDAVLSDEEESLILEEVFFVQ